MKTIIAALLILSGMQIFAQNKNTLKKKTNRKTHSTSFQHTTSTITPDPPRQTITEKYLNGNQPVGKTMATTQVKSDSSPFVGGIHAADNAAKKYDSVPPANPNSIYNNQNTAAVSNGNSNNDNNGNSINTGLINDSAQNRNTINQGGLTTTSGAVDKSGQAQFGQTNWGSNRGTVGEGQWTVPPPVSSSFSKEFPSNDNVVWSRSNTDNSVYSARYKSGADWIVSSYNSTGNHLDRRTEVSLKKLPQTVDTYIQRQPQGFQPTFINRLQATGKSEVYEIRTQSGQIIYLNDNGEEVNY